MTKTYTNTQIISIYESLLMIRNKSFPTKVSYTIVRNLKTLQPIYEDIISARETLIQNNGTLVEEENYYKIDPDKAEYVNQELKSLSEAENEINLTMFKLQDIESMELSIEAMESLYPMIQEDEG